ncbi:MAG: TonB family protein [Candidatus Saccharibacteria bacterium]|nr:TonB family protein [Moraxellaceae bacterium]
MNLVNRLLIKAEVIDGKNRSVRARILLDDAGKVKGVQIRHSSGDSALDQRAIAELKNAQYSPSRLGAKKVRVWYDVIWTSHDEV